MMVGFTHTGKCILMRLFVKNVHIYFTGDIENFNSLHNKYANKTFVYGHEGMSVRGNFLNNSRVFNWSK